MRLGCNPVKSSQGRPNCRNLAREEPASPVASKNTCKGPGAETGFGGRKDGEEAQALCGKGRRVTRPAQGTWGQGSTESGWGRENGSGGGEQSPSDGGLTFRGSRNSTTGHPTVSSGESYPDQQQRALLGNELSLVFNGAFS